MHLPFSRRGHLQCALLRDLVSPLHQHLTIIDGSPPHTLSCAQQYHGFPTHLFAFLSQHKPLLHHLGVGCLPQLLPLPLEPEPRQS